MKRRLLIPAAAATALLLPALSSGSGGDDREVRKAGDCNGSSSSKIKVKEDDGRLEVEFEVDQNRDGVTWKVKIKDNGDVVHKGQEVTRGPSGSFSLEQKIDDRSGADRIKAVGRERSGDERCVATLTF